MGLKNQNFDPQTNSSVSSFTCVSFKSVAVFPFTVTKEWEQFGEQKRIWNGNAKLQ